MLADATDIHHVTALVGGPQTNVDVDADSLDLRFVGRTGNAREMIEDQRPPIGVPDQPLLGAEK